MNLFWHWMHQWEPWGEPFTILDYGNRARLVQERRCKKCGEVEQRSVGYPEVDGS